MQIKERIVLIGFDGLMPEMLEKLIKDDLLPNFKNLYNSGSFSPLLSCPPVDTPTNWTSLATGCYPGTHGINTFRIIENNSKGLRYFDFFNDIFPDLKNRNRDFINSYCEADQIWNYLSSIGLKTLVVNYPGAWPAGGKNKIVVDGHGPYSSVLSNISGPCIYSTRNRKNFIKIYKFLGKKINLSSEYNNIYNSFIDISGQKIVNRKSIGKNLLKNEHIISITVIQDKTSKKYKISLNHKEGCNRKNEILGENEVSNWIYNKFETPGGKEIEGKFKIKILKITNSKNNVQIDIFRSPIYYESQWVYPENNASDLIDDAIKKRFGRNFEKIDENFTTSLIEYNLDEDMPKSVPLSKNIQKVKRTFLSPNFAQYESIEDAAESLYLTTRNLSNKFDWDALFIQLHSPDALNHRELNYLCREWKYYSEQEENKSWKSFIFEYKVLDNLVGKLMNDYFDKNVSFFIVSDHGSIPSLKRVWLGKYFLDEGLIKYRKIDKKMILDLDKSKVLLGDHPFAQNIWINSTINFKNGIVKSKKEHDFLIDHSINVLNNIMDKHEDRKVLSAVFKKVDAKFLGQWGKRIGDIVYYFAPRYINIVEMNTMETDINLYEKFSHSDFYYVEKEDTSKAFHHGYLPGQTYSGFSVNGTMLAMGSKIANNKIPEPVWTTDLFPTICNLLNINIPSSCEGKTIHNVFK